MPTIEDLLAHADKMLKRELSRTDYWTGYIRGLHIGNYGHDTGLDEDPEWQIESEQYRAGQTDGYHSGLMAEGVER